MGINFTVYTDNNPLMYILTTAKLDATGHRWVAALAAYNFTLNYRPGKANIDADVLSRIPWDKEWTVEPETVGHLLGNVISKVGYVIEVLHRAHHHSTGASAQRRTRENVCDRLGSSPKGGKRAKESD